MCFKRFRLKVDLLHEMIVRKMFAPPFSQINKFREMKKQLKLILAAYTEPKFRDILLDFKSATT